ncbi:MAG: HAMP domain-containing histidine kinase [Planctomycetaceae bacterium]|jgi:signal transduction histidine kinase|nr:HAMP domain-containing histidine kinase [Planctomycetaceae bacterium]
MTPSEDGKSADDWNAALEKAKLDALAEFAAGAGHEINNPLAIIRGHAQILLQKTVDSESKKHLGVILNQVQRIYEMIADIRLFARPPCPECVPMDLVSVLKNVIQEQSELVAKWNSARNVDRDIRIHWKFSAPDSLSVCFDPAHVHTIFAILCKNAVEAILANDSQTGEIEVSCETTQNSTIEVLVKNDAAAIPKEVLPHIFSPYYSGRQAGRGLGFGLSKAWRLLEQMNGRIEVYRENHDKTCFKVTFFGDF